VTLGGALHLENYYARDTSVLTSALFHFSASRIRYEITSGNIGGAFAVKNMTGAIYVAGALDYETRKRVSTSQRAKIYYAHRHNVIFCLARAENGCKFNVLLSEIVPKWKH